MTERDKQFNFERLVEAYENAVQHGYILYEVKKAKIYGIDGGYWYEIALEDKRTRNQNDIARTYVRIQARSDDTPYDICVHFDGDVTIDNIDIVSDSFCAIKELLLAMKNVRDEDGGKKIDLVLEFFDWLEKGMRLNDGNE